MLKQAILLLITSAVLGLGINLVSPNKVNYISNFRDLQAPGTGPIVPPSAQEGDPPFIDINKAVSEHGNMTSIFVDARDSAEFICGTIPASVNIPFDYLPSGDLAQYFDSVLNRAPKDTGLIVFCSGEECDLSLHLARNLRDFGYTNVSIFFGGAREWDNFRLVLERRPECED